MHQADTVITNSHATQILLLGVAPHHGSHLIKNPEHLML